MIDGTKISLRDPGETLVIYFFPKAFSPVCTKEACSFRDSAPRFEGVRVVGISRDSVEELSKFRDRYKLGHDFASDPELLVHRAFGAVLFGRLPRRATFMISTEGKILKSYSNEFSASGHSKVVP